MKNTLSASFGLPPMQRAGAAAAMAEDLSDRFLPEDLPSLAQLRSMLAEEKQTAPEEKQNTLLRVPAAAAQPQKSVVRPFRAAGQLPVQRAQAESAARFTAAELPTLQQLNLLLQSASDLSVEEDAPIAAPRKPVSAVPFRSSNKAVRPEKSSETPRQRAQVRQKEPQPTPAKPAPARPVKVVKAAPAEKKYTFTAEDIPSLKQLIRLQSEEKQFGNLSFQDSVREVKHTMYAPSSLSAAVAAPQETDSPADQATKRIILPDGFSLEDIPAAERISEPEEVSRSEASAPEGRSGKRRRSLFGGAGQRKKKQKSAAGNGAASLIDQLPTEEQLKNRAVQLGGRSQITDTPSDEQLKKEHTRVRYWRMFLNVLRNTVFTLITVSAVAVLIAVLLLPVLRIYGSSMTPTLEESDIVLSVKDSRFSTGNVVAFYYNNKILVKRVIAQSGDWVDIDADGFVTVNGELLDEPYVQDRAFGECDIELPYQVPENRVFVMGDHRAVSVDSRSTTIGCIAEEQIVGKIIYCIWPFTAFGPVK